MANNVVTIDIIAKDAASGVLNSLTSRMGALGGIIQSVASGNIAGALSTAVGAIVDETKKAITSTLEYGTQNQELSGIMGTNTEQSSALIQVSKSLGITHNELTTAVNNAIKNGFVPSVDALKKMAAEYQGLPSAMEKSKYATEKFGASAKTMQKVLDTTPSAIDEVVESARRLNLIWGNEQINQIEQYQESLFLLQQSYQSLQVTIGTELLPVLDLLSRAFTSGSDAIEDYRIKGAALLALMGYLQIAQAILGDDTLGLNEKIQALGESYLALRDASEEYGAGVSSASSAIAKSVTDATNANRSLLSLARQITSENRNYSESMADLTEERDKELQKLGELEQGYWSYQDAGRAVWDDLQSVERQLRVYRPALDETGESLRDLTARQAELKEELSGYDQVWGQDIRGIKDTKEALEEVETKIKEVEAAHKLASQQIVLDLLTQELAMDGLTSEETDYLIDLGIQWGIYDETIREEMRTARESVNELKREAMGIPRNMPITVTIDGFITKAGREALSYAGSSGGKLVNIGSDKKQEMRAYGGPVEANTPYVIGEKGPEIFIPRSGGKVIPNNQLQQGGGGGISRADMLYLGKIIAGEIQKALG